MKYIETHESFISKVKSFLKDKIKEQEPNSENNVTGSIEKQEELIEFIKDSIIYLYDDGEYNIKISKGESFAERGPKGEVIFGNTKTEFGVKVNKDNNSNNIDDYNFIIDDIRDQLLFMIDRVLNKYNVLRVVFIYQGVKVMRNDLRGFSPVEMNLIGPGESKKVSRIEFESLPHDKVISEILVCFSIL